ITPPTPPPTHTPSLHHALPIFRRQIRRTAALPIRRTARCPSRLPVEQTHQADNRRHSGTGLLLPDRSRRRRLSRQAQPRSLVARSEEHTSELQSLRHLVCRLLL